MNQEMLNSLTPLEQKLVNTLDMIHLKGKKGKHVTLILRPEVKLALQLIHA